MQRMQDSFDPMLPLLEFREVLLKMCVEFGPKASSDVLHRYPSRIKIILQAIFSETRTFLTNPSHISDQIFTRACEGGEASAPLSRGAAVVVGRQGKVRLRFYLFALAAKPIFHSGDNANCCQCSLAIGSCRAIVRRKLSNQCYWTCK